MRLKTTKPSPRVELSPYLQKLLAPVEQMAALLPEAERLTDRLIFSHLVLGDDELDLNEIEGLMTNRILEITGADGNDDYKRYCADRVAARLVGFVLGQRISGLSGGAR